MKKLLIIFILFAFVTPAWAAETTRLFGIITFFDITLENAEVTLTLEGQDHFTTSTKTIPAGSIVAYTSSSGYFAFSTVYMTDSLSSGATYTVTVKHPMTQAGGITFEASSLSITTVDSVSLRTILSQGL